MKQSTLGILILIFLAIAGVVGYKVLLPMLTEKAQRKTSDARGSSATIRIAGDNYLGYWFITSPEMRKRAAQKGTQIDFKNDGGAYADRLARFANKEYDCIVLPVNSYLEHGQQYKYPGVIVAGISESKGADGIVAPSSIMPMGSTVNELNNASLVFVFTGESPSSFLIDLTIANFNLDALQYGDSWKIPVGSSREVYDRAKRGEGDIFVLWEPDLSKALDLPGMRYVFGSDKFAGYIIDVFVFHRDFIKKHPQRARTFFETYFFVMRNYKNDRERMLKDMDKSTKLKRSAIEKMLTKIDWYDLRENAEDGFGLSKDGNIYDTQEGIIDTIMACTDVLVQTRRFDRDPLKGDPYKITNKSIIEGLYQSARGLSVARASAQLADFNPLGDAAWARLQEVGTLRTEPITFQMGNDFLSLQGKEKVDKFAKLVTNNYPGYRVAIRGHTGQGGDEQANVALSLRRSQAVKQYFVAVHSIDPDRVHAEGFGSSQPTPKKPMENPRAYRARQARVEFVLLESNPL